MTSAPASAPTRTVALPEEIVRGLEARMKGSAFENVDAFIAFVLGRLLDQSAEGEAFSAEDERQLKERLRSLGYID
jgi:Arc/MetJ-type ribon-helix-helix transcriptional regulator